MRLFRGGFFGVLVRPAFDRLRKMLRRLCALHCDNAAEDETGHPVDPGLLGRIGFPLHLRHVVVAAKAIAHAIGVESVLDCRPDEASNLASPSVSAATTFTPSITQGSASRADGLNRSR